MAAGAGWSIAGEASGPCPECGRKSGLRAVCPAQGCSYELCPACHLIRITSSAGKVTCDGCGGVSGELLDSWEAEGVADVALAEFGMVSWAQLAEETVKDEGFRPKALRRRSPAEAWLELPPG